MSNYCFGFTSRSLVMGCVGPWVTMRIAYALQTIPCPTSISPACQCVTPARMAAIPRAALCGWYNFLPEVQDLDLRFSLLKALFVNVISYHSPEVQSMDKKNIILGSKTRQRCFQSWTVPGRLWVCTHVYPSTILRAYSEASSKFCR